MKSLNVFKQKKLFRLLAVAKQPLHIFYPSSPDVIDVRHLGYISDVTDVGHVTHVTDVTDVSHVTELTDVPEFPSLRHQRYVTVSHTGWAISRYTLNCNYLSIVYPLANGYMLYIFTPLVRALGPNYNDIIS